MDEIQRSLTSAQTTTAVIDHLQAVGVLHEFIKKMCLMLNKQMINITYIVLNRSLRNRTNNELRSSNVTLCGTSLPGDLVV